MGDGINGVGGPNLTPWANNQSSASNMQVPAHDGAQKPQVSANGQPGNSGVFGEASNPQIQKLQTMMAQQTSQQIEMQMVMTEQQFNQSMEMAQVNQDRFMNNQARNQAGEYAADGMQHAKTLQQKLAQAASAG